MVFHKCVCLVVTENWVKLKTIYVLTVKQGLTPVKAFPVLFSLQTIYTPHTTLQAPHRSRTPHIVRRYSPSSLTHTPLQSHIQALARAPIAHPSTSESHPSISEIAPQTHPMIDPPRPSARSRHEPTNRSTHPMSDPLLD